MADITREQFLKMFYSLAAAVEDGNIKPIEFANTVWIVLDGKTRVVETDVTDAVAKIADPSELPLIAKLGKMTATQYFHPELDPVGDDGGCYMMAMDIEHQREISGTEQAMVIRDLIHRACVKLELVSDSMIPVLDIVLNYSNVDGQLKVTRQLSDEATEKMAAEFRDKLDSIFGPSYVKGGGDSDEPD